MEETNIKINETPQDKIDWINEYVYTNTKITLSDWQKDIMLKALDGTKIKKIWLVTNRKVGATTLCKLIHWLRTETRTTYVCSHNLQWSNCIKRIPIFVKTMVDREDEKMSMRSWWMIPMTYKNIINDVKKNRKKFEETKSNIMPEIMNRVEEIYDGSCMYDGEFNKDTYLSLKPYDWGLITLSFHTRDYEKVKPYIEADKVRDDVIILVDDKLPLWNENKNI
jgi:hypothetical protein